MCRFIAYLGKKPLILSQMLDAPENSLINQSRQAQISKIKLNADGFGIGWYDHSIDQEPGLFKSIRPAWNDPNLKHIASKIRSQCFVGHVRASTTGDVDTFNCHPFLYQSFLFAHNGAIHGFEDIRRHLLRMLDDHTFRIIQGQTDTEHFFALMMGFLYQNEQPFTLNHFADAFVQSTLEIKQLQQAHSNDSLSKINSVLTDGEQMIVTRYISDPNQPSLSLYYTPSDYIDEEGHYRVIQSANKEPGAVLVASEPLDDIVGEWKEIPSNHMLFIDKDLKMTLKPILMN